MKVFTSYHRKKLTIVLVGFLTCMLVLTGQLVRIMIIHPDKYGDTALAVQQRERSIKAQRGIIFDRNGIPLAGNKAVCSISVIHSQITDEEAVIRALVDKLDLDEEFVAKRVKKISVREKIKSNVEKSVADEIRNMALNGVMVDEDYKRYYPYDTLCSHVLGFTGADNQGIVGLEVSYDKILMGRDGSINTFTNAKGIEISDLPESRVEPISGKNLVSSIDINLQQYATEKAIEVLNLRQAKRVCIIMMNPQNGEIYALVDVPEYNLNDPFTLNDSLEPSKDDEENQLDIIQDLRNRMWRCTPVNDTYEPGSTFKIITATAAFEHQVLHVEDRFYCPGYHMVEDRRIRCHKVSGHGAESFRDGIMNSCNPVFMQVGERVGREAFYDELRRLGLFEKTGVDLPGEANSIFHKLENVGPVELATMSFGQSFQITPLQLMRAVSAVVNGGKMVTPHFGMYVTDQNNHVDEVLEFAEKENVVSGETSETMKLLLEAVVSEGTGHKAYVPGFTIGGKTATSEKLPRSEKKYISSFLGFAPAENPTIMTLILIDEPTGTYYGGTIAAPVVGEIYDNILPYLGIKKQAVDEESVETIYIEDTVF